MQYFISNTVARNRLNSFRSHKKLCFKSDHQIFEDSLGKARISYERYNLST